MKQIYEVKYKSKEKQDYTFRTLQESEKDSICACIVELEKKGWLDQYDYRYESCKVVKTTQQMIDDNYEQGKYDLEFYGW